MDIIKLASGWDFSRRKTKSEERRLKGKA